MTKINLELANQITGWMTYNELRWLAKQAKKHTRIVEIGSYMGRSTRALGDHTPGSVVAIDDFKGPRDMRLPDFMRQGIAETFMYGLGDLIQSSKVVMVVADHASINIDFSPDMVFLDGSHDYQDVKRDIQMWLPRLQPGGLLCGHDYTNMFGVRQAVAETIKHFKVARGTTIWYTKT